MRFSVNVWAEAQRKLDNAELAGRVYRCILDAVEGLSENEPLAVDLAHLLGSIVTGGYCSFSQDSDIILLLRRNCPGPRVWEFIEVNYDEEDTDADTAAGIAIAAIIAQDLLQRRADREARFQMAQLRYLAGEGARSMPIPPTRLP